jgi:protein-disulfide isomerase
MAKRANRGPRPTPPAPKSTTPATPSTASTSAAGSDGGGKRLGSAVAAKERREERQREARRTQQMYLVGGLVVTAVLIALLFFSANQPAEAPIPADAVARYQGIEQGQDEEGFPRLGSGTAPVKVVEFASFGCPGCAQFHRDVYPQLLERVKSGDVSYTYVPLLTGEGNVNGAARVALCADDQGKFWETHDTLFSWQNVYVANAFNQNRLTSGVRALGLDEGRINGCVNSQPISDLITRAASKDVTTTPTLRVNNTLVESNDWATLSTAIDNALANAPRPRATSTVTAPSTPQAPTTEASDATEAATAEATSTTAEATADATAD